MFERHTAADFQNIVDKVDSRIQNVSRSMQWADRMLISMQKLNKLGGASNEILVQTELMANKQRDLLHKQMLRQEGISKLDYDRFMMHDTLAKLAQQQIDQYNAEIVKIQAKVLHPEFMKPEASDLRKKRRDINNQINERNIVIGNEEMKGLQGDPTMIKNLTAEIAGLTAVLVSLPTPHKLVKDAKAQGEHQIEVLTQQRQAIQESVHHNEARKDEIANQIAKPGIGSFIREHLTMVNAWKVAGVAALTLAEGFAHATKIVNDAGVAYGESAREAGRNTVDSIQSFFTRGTIISSSKIAEISAAFGTQMMDIHLANDVTRHLIEDLSLKGIQIQDSTKLFSTFFRLSGGDQTSAQNKLREINNVAKNSGAPAGAVARELSANSDLFARSMNNTSDSLERAAINAVKLGTSLSKIDSLGDEVTGDFEGFLKKQAILQTVMRGFDLSQFYMASVRGDTKGAQEALIAQFEKQKAMGNDVGKMLRPTQQMIEQQLHLSTAEMIAMENGKTLLKNTKGAEEGPGDNLSWWNNFKDSTAKLAVDFGGIGRIIEFILGRQILRAELRGAFSSLGGAGKVAPIPEIGAAEAASGVAEGASMLGGASKILGRVAVPLVAGMEGYEEYQRSMANKEIHAKRNALAVGATSGLGMLGGAEAGATIGALITGPLAPIGGLIGGAIGGIIGLITGKMAGETLTSHATSNTLSPQQNTMLDSLNRKIQQKNDVSIDWKHIAPKPLTSPIGASKPVGMTSDTTSMMDVAATTPDISFDETNNLLKQILLETQKPRVLNMNGRKVGEEVVDSFRRG